MVPSYLKLVFQDMAGRKKCKSSWGLTIFSYIVETYKKALKKVHYFYVRIVKKKHLKM